MPQHKVPRSLYECACNKLNNIIDTACNNIWEAHKSYSSDEARHAISLFQRFLTSQIPVTVLDDVLNMKKSDGTFFDMCCNSMADLRLLLMLIMHRDMRTFKVTNLDIPKTIISRIEDTFWVSCLRDMSHLVVLDLSLVCTDNILEIIGKCCPLLEEVTVVSKMSQTKKGGNFNALSKVYHVSDKGLQHLTCCKKLKRITLNASRRSGLGHITEQGIYMLLCGLPNLRFINYEYMGSVLAHIPPTSPPLQLLHLKDLRSNPSNIMSFNCLCPSLVVLHVSLPTNLSQDEYVKQSEAMVRFLVLSNLKLQCLQQSFTHFTSNLLSSLLITKGTNLTSLRFGLGCSSFDSTTLLLIGRYCPNLEDLSISTMGPDTTAINSISMQNSKFEKLKYLSLSGKLLWNVSHSLHLCLRGRKVTHLYLCGPDFYIDQVLMKLIAVKYLCAIKTLLLFQNFYISNSTVWHVLNNCPAVCSLHCLFNKELTVENAQQLHTFVSDNNFDVDLNFSDGYHTWIP